MTATSSVLNATKTLNNATYVVSSVRATLTTSPFITPNGSIGGSTGDSSGIALGIFDAATYLTLVVGAWVCFFYMREHLE